MADIDLPPAVVPALWLVLAAWAFVWGVPLAVCSAESSRFSIGGEENPAAVAPDGTDPVYAAAAAALVRLGYEPVGPGWVRYLFYHRWWEVRTELRVYRNRTAGRFAYFQTCEFYPDWPQPSVLTCWADGGLTRTATGLSPEAGAAAGGYDVELVRLTASPAALEARHAEREAAREAEGATRDPDLSLGVLLAAERRHAYVAVAVPAAHAAWAELGVMLFLGFGLVGVSALWSGGWPVLPPAAGLVGLAWFQFRFRVQLAKTCEYVREQLLAATAGGA